MWLDDIADWRRSEMAYHVQTTDGGAGSSFFALDVAELFLFILGLG
jgi:hypothetical protein